MPVTRNAGCPPGERRGRASTGLPTISKVPVNMPVRDWEPGRATRLAKDRC